MTIPTLLLTRSSNYNFSEPSYDTWYWSSEFRCVVISRWWFNSTAQPVLIVPSNYNFNRHVGHEGPKLLVVGIHGCVPSLVTDSSSVLEEATDWKSSSSTGNFQIYKIGSQLRFMVADIAVGLVIPTFYTAICISKDGKVSIGTQIPAASTVLDLESTTGALLLPRMTTAQRNLLTAATV